MLTPEDISSRRFLVSLRGYDRDEVHAFLVEVAEQVAAAQARAEAAEAGAGAAEARLADAQARSDAAEGRLAEAEARAQEAQAARERAEADAARPLAEAREEAARIVGDAEERRRALDQAVAELTVARDRIATELRQLSRTVERTLTQAHVAPGTGDPLRDALADVVRDNVRTAEDDEAEAGSATTAPGPGPAAVPGTEAATTAPPAHDAGATPPAPEDDRPPAAPPAGDRPPALYDDPAAPPADPTAAASAGFAPGARLAAPPGAEALTPQLAQAQALRGDALPLLHAELVAALRGAVQPLRDDVVARLDAAGGAGHTSDFLLDPDAPAALAAAGEPVLAAVWRAGTANGRRLAGGDAGGDRDARGDQAEAGAGPEPDEPLAEELAGAVADELADALPHALRPGLDADEDVEALTGRVDAVVAEVAGGPLTALAGLAVLRAYEEALLAAWQVGGTAGRRWALSAEPRCPDPRCADNHRAGSVPLDEPFPSGHRLPPLRVGCNCTTLPDTAISEPAS